MPAAVGARVPLDRDVNRRRAAPAPGDIGTDSDAASRGAAAVVEGRGSLARSGVGDGDDDATGGGDDEYGNRADEQTAGGHRGNHRQFARSAQATGFVTDRPRLRSTVVTETLAVALPPKAASAGVDFEKLYRSSRDDLYAYAASLLRDRAAAEEVTAAAFERAYRRRRTFNPRRGSARAWLFGIARNAALDELRRRRRVADLAVDPEDVEAAAPEVGADRAVARAAVRSALASLEPRERELIALKFFAGLSNRELARVLGVSESNAGTLLHRAVTKLRKACHETA